MGAAAWLDVVKKAIFVAVLYDAFWNHRPEKMRFSFFGAKGFRGEKQSGGN
ncbi:OLC1v1028044C1 [Oldenlandia corymbosa var. corymbosa]|uniref:OLC1v1028044C1 n=1 Tax=Oldenlandia corymbosa var. corymbosa TaxID=529605 RepID=A0AAV1CCM5_OLDCO|nr:OLC1v1028044C1 [Oldenlandia corymbosa var. corymbosa]